MGEEESCKGSGQGLGQEKPSVSEEMFSEEVNQQVNVSLLSADMHCLRGAFSSPA